MYGHLQRELQVVAAVPEPILRNELPEVLQALLTAPDGDGSTVLMDWLCSRGYLRPSAPRAMVAQYASRVTAHLRLLPHAEPCPPRSEEHTSELQSQSNLVCRL